MQNPNDRCECGKIRKRHYHMRLPNGGYWTAAIGGDCRGFKKIRTRRKK